MIDPEPVLIRSSSFDPDAAVVPYGLVTDSRLSATDLGVYLRCQWLLHHCHPHGDLNWLIRELRMPTAETCDSLQRLVKFGYLGMVEDAEAEWESSPLTAHPCLRRPVEKSGCGG